MVILADILSYPPHVALTINRSSALDLETLHILEVDHVANFTVLGVKCPQVVSL